MAVFHVFQIVQMVQNRTKRLDWLPALEQVGAYSESLETLTMER